MIITMGNLVTQNLSIIKLNSSSLNPSLKGILQQYPVPLNVP